MGNLVPKMLLPLCGKPLLYWTLKNLEHCSAVGAIVLAAPNSHIKKFEDLVRQARAKKVVRVVEGGKERVDSTVNALPWLPPECEWVGVHDGARPFVSAKNIEDCFKGALYTGAAILALPVKETVKMVNRKGEIKKTIPRSELWTAQTPQVFRRDILTRMYNFKRNKKIDHSHFTDDSLLAESLGVLVKIVPGSDKNIKITAPLDLVLAETIIKRGWARAL